MNNRVLLLLSFELVYSEADRIGAELQHFTFGELSSYNHFFYDCWKSQRQIEASEQDARRM